MMKRRHFTLSACGGALLLSGLTACGKETEAAPATVAQTTTPSTSPAAAATAPSSDGEKAWQLAQKGHGFSTGPVMARNTVYVFFDTTCPHCAHLWQQSEPLRNQLKIVWMPLGLLRPQSGPQGATIMSAADPIAAMTQNETSVLARGGGITASQSLPDGVLDKVKENTELFNQIGADSVPLIVFKNAKSGQYGKHAGAVDTATLAAMAGL